MINRYNLQNIPGFNGGIGDGYGSTFYADLETGLTYKELYLKLNNLTAAQIKQVHVTLNGEDIVKLTGLQLIMLQKFKGEFSQDDIIVIPFTDHVQSGLADQNFSELVTVRSDKLHIEIEVGASTSLQIDKMASINPSAMYGPLREGGRTRVPRLFSTSFRVTNTGDVTHNLLSQAKLANLRFYKRIHIFDKSNISQLELKLGGVSRFKLADWQNDYLIKRHGRHVQDNYFHFDAVFSGFAAIDAFAIESNVVTDLITTVTKAEDFSAVIEVVDELTVPISVD